MTTTPAFGQRRLHVAVLGVLAVATRIPFLGTGEPDSALFVIGLRQWLRDGPGALFIYSAKVCAVYYATVARIIQVFGIPPQQHALMMSILSMIAGVGIVICGYAIGVRFVGRRASFVAMLLFVMSPGLWWITIEPHPQAPSIAFALLGLWSFVRYEETRRLWFAVTAGVLFMIAISLKIDGVLMGLAFLAVAVWRNPERPWRAVAVAAVVCGLGAIGSQLLTRLAIGPIPVAATVAATEGFKPWGVMDTSRYVKDVANFVFIPGPFEMAKQWVPVAFGFGLVTAVLMAVGIFLAVTRDPDRRWWLIMIGLWSLPGYLFWVTVPGNNTRHVVAYGLPLLWLAASHLRTSAAVACVVVSVLIPANSNMFLFPSPNVPRSALLAESKRGDIKRVGEDLVKSDSCFVGSYSLDYLTEFLTQKGATITAANSVSGDLKLRMPDQVEVELRRTDPGRDKTIALAPCLSVEYAPSGEKARFLGSEWHVPHF